MEALRLGPGPIKIKLAKEQHHQNLFWWEKVALAASVVTSSFLWRFLARCIWQVSLIGIKAISLFGKVHPNSNRKCSST